jgi:hypothetical protein
VQGQGDMRVDGSTREIAIAIACNAVDILAGSEYSMWKLQDLDMDTEDISNGTCMHAQAAQREA